MIDYYEALAKTHMDQYLDLLMKKPKINLNINLIGQRRQPSKKKPKTEITQKFALQFFESLMDSYHNFKIFCHKSKSTECSMFNTDNSILATALKDYENMLE